MIGAQILFIYIFETFDDVINVGIFWFITNYCDVV